MSAQWKDTTSYARDDRERKARCWSLEIGKRLSLVVVTGHVCFPKGTWVCHLHPLWEGIDLAAQDEESAKMNALGLAQATLNEMNAAWEAILR